MKACPYCSEQFTTGAGLASHRRAKHARQKGPNRKAFDAMMTLISLPDEAVALMQAGRSMADCLDMDPSNAQMWKCYRELVDELKGDDGDSDPWEKLKAEIARDAQMGNAPKT